MMKSLLLLSLLLTFRGSISSITMLPDSILMNAETFLSQLLQRQVQRISDPRLDDSNCSQELLQFWGDLDSQKRAAYLDSLGKVGAGILTGNVQYLGYYDQCIDIGNTDYCRFPFDMTLTTNTTVLSNASVTIQVPVEFGMCYPSSCDANDFYNLVIIGWDEVFYNITSSADIFPVVYSVNVTAASTGPHCPWRDLKWTNSSIVVLSVCILLVVLVIIGTMVDVLIWLIDYILPKFDREPQKTMTHSTNCDVKHSSNEDRPLNIAKNKQKTSADNRDIEFVKDLLLSFSLYKTVPAIIATHQSPNAITSINGIRVISMLWILLGHAFTWGMELGNNGAGFANIREVADTVLQRFPFQLVDYFSFSVDSFFVLSGLLLSYLSIKEMDRRQGKFPFITFYVHRLIRLSPSYYLAVFIYFKLLPHVGSGPLWFFDQVNNCEKYWWTNILYINNFYPIAAQDECYQVTWYLANLMQFYIISPIFLLLLYHSWKIGFVTIGGIMLTSIAITGTFTGITNLNANVFQSVSRVYEDNIYIKPYCRINAYLIGILLGFVLYKRWKVRSKLWVLICFYGLMWIIAIGSCLIVIFGQYGTWHGHPFTKAENVMYFMFSRITFSTGIALMIYACHNGFGGAINRFLSWSFWVPMSHLNYNTYLYHPMVFTLMYSAVRFQYIYTDWLLIILFAAAVLLSYSLALIVAVIVEYPVANIENAVYKFAGIKRK